ncbi:MAG TPA: FAD:protein FMN transferase [Burkholderiales bacterium]|nr:FAD:protein FMN transferase [Burkholderiales bacterium]
MKFEAAPVMPRLNGDLRFVSKPAGGRWMAKEEAIMGTAIRVELWHADPALGEAALDAAMREMHRIDRAMSPFKPDSELSRLNRDAGKGPVPASREMFELIERSIEFSELSGGAFDITFASVGSLFDYRNGIKPAADELAAALPAVDYRYIRLDHRERTIRFAHEKVKIDLGGIAKGHAVDNCIALLKSRGVAQALVMAGGDSRVLGDKRGRPWVIGVQDPRRKNALVARIPLVDAAISTSGDYERYFEADGVRYHHILDPKTGASATGARSVTIIGPDATTTEGISKSAFVKGPEDGIRFVEALPGIDAVIVDGEGRMHYTAGLHRESTAVHDG